MNTYYVVDTNVIIVANLKNKDADELCKEYCIEKITNIQLNSRIIIDDNDLIFNEYCDCGYLDFSGQPGIGDEFFAWIVNNRYNKDFCLRIPIHPDTLRTFKEFPDDPKLTQFDPDDRKFIAVAIASKKNPKILEATDTDFWYAQDVLSKYVNIEFICPDLIRTLAEKKQP